jgi:hypothetical protein
MVDRPGGDVRAWRWAGGSLAGCSGLLMASGHTTRTAATALLVVATILLTFGEIWHSAGGWQISYRFAPADRRVEYLSIFALGFTVQEIAGPIAVVALIAYAGNVGWIVLTLLFIAAALLAGPGAALAGRTAHLREPATDETQEVTAATA